MTEEHGHELLDCGDGRKLERYGSYILDRPASQALWAPQKPAELWEDADAFFTREGANSWEGRHRLPDLWKVNIGGITFRLQSTDFGHLGVFPEQQQQWDWITQRVSQRKGAQVLNLFAYSGGSTLAAARGGASVCHLDASKGMVTWARENAIENGLEKAPIRWIVDDATRFVIRELKRGRRYDAIIMDPPTFGRGKSGELFKIEEHLLPLLHLCSDLLSDNPLFMLLSCHTPGATATVLQQLLAQSLPDLPGTFESGEMLIPSSHGFSLPSGTYSRWIHG